MAARGEGWEAAEAPEPPPPGTEGGVNYFASDGSFLRVFKRMMKEEEQRREREAAAAAEASGGGGGGTGLGLHRDGVKTSGGALSFVLMSKGDAWAKYLAEVQKYKAHECSDDNKTRPLFK